jgi:hypothetical protein
MNQEKNISTKRTFIYQLYLYSEPYLLVLDDDFIIEVNIDKNLEHKDILIVETEDVYFHENLKALKTKDFTVVFQSFDSKGNFINKMEFYGENFEIVSKKLILEFESTLIDNVSDRINPYWSSAIDLYKKERVSYIRNKNIETLLS